MRKVVFLFVSIFLAIPVYAQTTISFDFPVISKAITVDAERLKDLSVNTGPVSDPWGESLKYDFAPIPELQLVSRDVWLHGSGYKHLSKDEALTRKSQAAFFKAKVSFWYIYVSGDGFVGEEKSFSEGSVFSSEFSRQSLGGRGWLGVKFGQFGENFILVKAGPGQIATRGQQKLKHPALPDLETFELYSEQFNTKSFGLEMGLKVKILKFTFEGENINYQRILHSPDPLRYGLNRFSDTKVNLDVELTPLKKFDVIRVVVRGSHVFGENHSLLFHDTNPSFQAFVRLAIK